MTLDQIFIEIINFNKYFKISLKLKNKLNIMKIYYLVYYFFQKE